MANLKNRKAFRAGVLIATFAMTSLLLGTSMLQAQVGANPYQQAVLDLDPVFYASFDDDVQPIVGPESPNAIDIRDEVYGVVPGGASLRGGGELVWVNDQVDPTVFLRNGVTTYEYWFVAFPDNDFGSGTVRPYSASSTISRSGYNNNGSITLRNSSATVSNREFANGTTIFQSAEASLEVPEWGVWHHVAVVVDRQTGPGYAGAGLARVSYYLDGELESQSDFEQIDGFPLDNGVDNFSSFVTISAPFDSFYDSSPPRIDEFAIYDRALTQEEIQSHIALATPVNPPQSLPNPLNLGYDGNPYTGSFSSEFYPLCVVAIDINDGWCFSDTFGRDGYIEDALLGTNDYGTIWIGRFDEEAVAP